MNKMNFEDYKNKELILSELEYELIKDFIKLRKDNNLSQKQLGDAACVIRETVAKIENQITSPQINTLIKLLAPLGYTLKIVKIENDSLD